MKLFKEFLDRSRDACKNNRTLLGRDDNLCLSLVALNQINNIMFAKETYIARRAKLKQTIGSGLLLFLGNDESGMNYADNT